MMWAVTRAAMLPCTLVAAEDRETFVLSMSRSGALFGNDVAM